MTRTPTRTFYTPIVPGQSLDSTQLALVVSVCLAACQEALQALGRETPIPREGEHNTAYGLVDDTARAEAHDVDETHSAHAEKRLLTVKEAARQLSIGRPKMWQLVMRGEVRSFKIGALRRIPVQALDEYVEQMGGVLMPDTSGTRGRSSGSNRSNRSNVVTHQQLQQPEKRDAWRHERQREREQDIRDSQGTQQNQEVKQP